MSDQQDKNKKDKGSAQKKSANKGDISDVKTPEVDPLGEEPSGDAEPAEAPGDNAISGDSSAADKPQAKSSKVNRQEKAAMQDPIEASAGRTEPPNSAPVKTTKGGSSAPGWIALILVLVLAGGS
ncbi:MAG: hypothetical protein AAGI44_10370, partial [Pseudomonadota bacterium]